MALPISVLKEKCLRGRILALTRCPPLRSEAKLKMAGLLRSESAIKVGHLCSQEHKTRKVRVFFERRYPSQIITTSFHTHCQCLFNIDAGRGGLGWQSFFNGGWGWGGASYPLAPPPIIQPQFSQFLYTKWIINVPS